MQSDLKQATRFEALSVVHMNALLLIKGKELKPNNFMMVSTVLPPIQRASITPLLTSHQSPVTSHQSPVTSQDCFTCKLIIRWFT